MDNRESDNQRRVKIVMLNPTSVVSLLNAWQNPMRFYCVPITKGIPEDVEIVSVSPNLGRGVFDLLLRHPSFDLVEMGTEPPRIPTVVDTLRTIDVYQMEKPVLSNILADIEPANTFKLVRSPDVTHGRKFQIGKLQTPRTHPEKWCDEVVCKTFYGEEILVQELVNMLNQYCGLLNWLNGQPKQKKNSQNDFVREYNLKPNDNEDR